jgi:hypothetical protein
MSYVLHLDSSWMNILQLQYARKKRNSLRGLLQLWLTKGWKYDIIEVFAKYAKQNTNTPCLVIKGVRFKKHNEKQVHWVSMGIETQFNNKFVFHLAFFFYCLQTIIIVAMCIVIVNIIEFHAFNAKFQHFIPIFNQISLLCLS